jgi:hypothetical protein
MPWSAVRRSQHRDRAQGQASDPHAGYGTRAELHRKQCQELANFELPKEIDWSMFEGLDFEASASKPLGRPKKQGA